MAGMDPALASIQDKRRIKVTAQFQIPLAEPQVFLLDMVEPFLRNRMQRDDSPYTIVLSQSEPWDAGAMQGVGSSRPRGPRPGTMAPRTDPMTNPGRTGGSTNLEQLAPIENPATAQGGRTGSTGQDQSSSSLVTITWYAVLDPMNEDSIENNGDEP